MFIFKKFYFLFLSVVLVSACAANKGTNIDGEITGAKNMSVFLDKMNGGNNSEILLTAVAGEKGEFEFKLPEGVKKGVYRLRIGQQILDLIMDGSEKQISVKGNLTDLNNFNYTITGSPLSEEYLRVVNSYVNQKMDVPALQEYTAKQADPLIGYQIASRLFTYRPDFTALHKDVSKRLTEKYPDLELSKTYAQVADQLDKQMQMQNASAKIKVGEMAPDISLPGPDGKVRKLSDYRGKLVLIDFWASWCGPCRKANPHVVEIYKKYQSKGFDVFSVSLDGIDSRTANNISDPAQLEQMKNQQKERWLGAIAQDNLIWDGHVSDLKKWECAPAGEYGVRSIPQTFLIGRDGKIVAVNPRNDLEEQVLKFL